MRRLWSLPCRRLHPQLLRHRRYQPPTSQDICGSLNSSERVRKRWRCPAFVKCNAGFVLRSAVTNPLFFERRSERAHSGFAFASNLTRAKLPKPHAPKLEAAREPCLVQRNRADATGFDPSGTCRDSPWHEGALARCLFHLCNVPAGVHKKKNRHAHTSAGFSRCPNRPTRPAPLQGRVPLVLE